MIDINELRRKIQSDDIIDHIDIHANVKPILTELLGRIEAAEKERDALRAAVRHEADCVEAAKAEIDELRAKVEAMERQEPVSSVWRCDNGHIHGSCEKNLPMGTKLYALPGAQAQPAPSVPEGWKLVPIEPTGEMINKVIDERLAALVSGKDHSMLDIYRAMLAAAPEAKP